MSVLFVYIPFWLAIIRVIPLKEYLSNLNKKIKNRPWSKNKTIKWHFSELIRNLIVLSSKADRQNEIMGYGDVAYEMVHDFEWHYSPFQDFLDKKLLTPEQVEYLNKIHQFLDDRDYSKNPEFWGQNNLEANPDWETLRHLAKNALKILHKEDLTIEVKRTIENTKSDKGEPLVIERTQTKVVKKNRI